MLNKVSGVGKVVRFKRLEEKDVSKIMEGIRKLGFTNPIIGGTGYKVVIDAVKAEVDRSPKFLLVMFIAIILWGISFAYIFVSPASSLFILLAVLCLIIYMNSFPMQISTNVKVCIDKTKKIAEISVYRTEDTISGRKEVLIDYDGEIYNEYLEKVKAISELFS